jgi:hypothetical protein
VKSTDFEFQTKAIDKVSEGETGWTITTDDGWSFHSPGKEIAPHVGDSARFYGGGIGSIVRGLDIIRQGTDEVLEVFYRTPAQQRAKFEEEQAERDREKEQELIAEQPARDQRRAALPLEFQDRLNIFENNNPLFRRDFEPYELMVCEQAVAMAARFPTPGRLKAFHKADWEKQKEMFPELDGGHSGNSFGASVNLAGLFLTNPDLVAKQHGAMCPLVGCKDYGCYASNPPKSTAKASQ